MKDFRNILLSLLTVSLLTACTQDELADGTQFAEGQYPLVINTASIGSPATRAYTPSTPEGVWDDGMTIWVQVINDYDPTQANNSAIDWKTATKLKYSVASDGTMTLAEDQTVPLWEHSKEKKLIRAWYCRSTTSPYSVLEELPTEWNVLADQYNFENENYSSYRYSDFLFAQQEFSFGDEVSLTFYHQVAKVVVNINGQPLKAKNLTVSSVYLKYAKLFKASYSYVPPAKPSDGYYGEWTKPSGNTSLADIIMKPATANTGVDFGSETGTKNADFTFEALAIPQTTSSNYPLDIRISVKSDDGYDNMWSYKFTSPVTWKAGHVYTYNLTLTPSGLKLSSINVSIGWDTTTGASDKGEVVL